MSIILPTAYLRQIVFFELIAVRKFCAMVPVILKKKIGLRIEQGHPWIFGNEIAETDEAVKPGDIVSVFNGDKKFIGKGFFNPQSQIALLLHSLGSTMEPVLEWRPVSTVGTYKINYSVREQNHTLELLMNNSIR